MKQSAKYQWTSSATRCATASALGGLDDVVVFDELDAFTRERGSLSGDTSGIRDSVVNQLLAKMDGVEQLENVLIVGLTNRPELIDAALLRPGRLEVQVEVPRPDAAGRQQILRIQSAELRERGSLEPRAAACLASGALERRRRRRPPLLVGALAAVAA